MNFKVLETEKSNIDQTSYNIVRISQFFMISDLILSILLKYQIKATFRQ